MTTPAAAKPVLLAQARARSGSVPQRPADSGGPGEDFGDGSPAACDDSACTAVSAVGACCRRRVGLHDFAGMQYGTGENAQQANDPTSKRSAMKRGVGSNGTALFKTGNLRKRGRNLATPRWPAFRFPRLKENWYLPPVSIKGFSSRILAQLNCGAGGHAPA